MKNILDIDTLEDDKCLSYKTEIIKLYYDEFKYRHTHFWQIYFKFIYAMLFLFFLGFIGNQYVKEVNVGKKILLIVLIISILLVTIISCILLNEEYYRIRCVLSKYKELLEHVQLERNIFSKYLYKIFGDLLGYLLYLNY